MAGYRSKISGTTGTNPTTVSGGVISPEPSGQGITVAKVRPPPFSLNPGLDNTSLLIDYTSVTCIKIFNSATENYPKCLMASTKG